MHEISSKYEQHHSRRYTPILRVPLQQASSVLRDGALLRAQTVAPSRRRSSDMTHAKWAPTHPFAKQHERLRRLRRRCGEPVARVKATETYWCRETGFTAILFEWQLLQPPQDEYV